MEEDINLNEFTNRYNPKMILFLLFMGNLFSAMDRFLINYAAVHISDDLTLSASATGLMLSIFFLGYAIMQIPGGWLADRFGATVVLFVSIVGFSIFTGITGLAWSLTALIIVRFIFGLMEGSFFPAGAKMIATAVPEEKRSRAMSVFLSALTVAGVIAPLVATTMLVQVGWRAMFIIIGVSGLLIGLLYWVILKPKVIRHNAQASQLTMEHAKPLVKGSLKKLLKTPFIISLMAASFSYGFIAWGVISWMPTYLVKERGLDLLSLGVLQMIPALTGVLFFLIAGYVLDKVKDGLEKWLGAASGLGLALLVYLMFNAQTVAGLIFYQSLLPIFQCTLSVIIFSLPIKRLPEAVGGSAVGVVNLGMQVAGFAAPLGIGFIIDALDGSYNGAVWLLVSFGVVCFLSFLTLQGADKKKITDKNAEIIPISPQVETE